MVNNSPAFAIVDLPDVLTDGGKLLLSISQSNLKFELLSIFGPGGGNPCCRLSGSYNSILDWLSKEYMPGEEEECMDLIETC